MHPLRKVRLFVCLGLLCLLFVGKPICLTFNCENGIHQVETKEGDNSSSLQAALNECNPVGLTCDRISFSSALRGVSNTDTLTSRISLPFAIFALSVLSQFSVLFFGANSDVNKSPLPSGCSWLGALHLYELFLYVAPIIYSCIDGIPKAYANFMFQYVFKHRADYFVAIIVLYVFGLITYLFEACFYLLNKREDTGEHVELFFSPQCHTSVPNVGAWGTTPGSAPSLRSRGSSHGRRGRLSTAETAALRGTATLRGSAPTARRSPPRP